MKKLRSKIKPLHIVELEYILEALKEFDGNRTKASEALQISVRKIRTVIQKATDLGYNPTPPKTGVPLRARDGSVFW